MRTFRALAVLALIPAGGCFPSGAETPEEHALDVFEDAEAHFAARRYADAVAEYTFVIGARERWKEPYYKLARCHEAMGHEEEAVKTLEGVLRFDRSDETARVEIARLQTRIEAMRKR